MAARDRLARLAGLEAAELVGVLVEDVRDLEQREAAGLGRREAPASRTRPPPRRPRGPRPPGPRPGRARRRCRRPGSRPRCVSPEAESTHWPPMNCWYVLTRSSVSVTEGLQGTRAGVVCPRCRMRPAIVRHSARAFQRGPSRATAPPTRGRRSGQRARSRRTPDGSRRRGLAQLARQRLEVHAVAEPLRERVGGALRVVAGAVEPAIDGLAARGRGPAGTGRTRRAWTSPRQASRPR